MIENSRRSATIIPCACGKPGHRVEILGQRSVMCGACAQLLYDRIASEGLSPSDPDEGVGA